MAGDAAPASLDAWRVSVPVGGGLRYIRGPLGAHKCGYAAILFALAGMGNEAIEWLQVAQSHNAKVKTLFANNPDLTLSYMLSREDYIERAGRFWALNLGNPVLGLIKTAIDSFGRSHNPDREPAHLIPPARWEYEPSGPYTLW